MATWVMSIASSTGYFGILLLMFVENVFPPIPSEVIMPLAGYMAAQGKLSLFGIILSGMAGSVLGALPLYYLGSKFGEERLKEFADNHGRWLTLSRKDIERAKRWFDRHGGAAMFFCRLIPGVRSLISIPAGIAGMKILPFLAYTATGTGIWAALLAYLGYFLGTEYTQVGKYLDPVSWIVLGAVGVLYFVRVIGHKGQKSEKRTATLESESYQDYHFEYLPARKLWDSTAGSSLYENWEVNNDYRSGAPCTSVVYSHQLRNFASLVLVLYAGTRLDTSVSWQMV